MNLIGTKSKSNKMIEKSLNLSCWLISSNLIWFILNQNYEEELQVVYCNLMEGIGK